MNTRSNTIIRSLGTLLLVLLPVGASFTAFAQVPGATVRRGGLKSGRRILGAGSPYQQRLSPYLDLLRTDNSALSPYHTFVRPKQQIRATTNAQESQLRQLQRTVQRDERSRRSLQRLQTGRGATFNNHSHFYQFQTN